MAMSFRTARNFGLIILLIIIISVSVFSYAIMTRNSQRLTEIITIDEMKLRSWYDVAEIVASAKDHLYDNRLGRSEVLAPVDLLINRALREVEAIQELGAGEDELETINEVVKTARQFKQAIYAFDAEIREGYNDASSLEELEDLAIRMANRMANLGKGAAAYVGKRIEEKHKAVLDISSFSKRMLGWVLLASIFVTVIVALFIAQALAQPIKILVDGTRRLAAGDLTHRVEVGSRDEIGQLANSFNSMAEELRVYRNNLLAAKAYTDNIIKSMINTLVVMNVDGTIRTVNKATCDLLGYTEKELLGEPVAKIFAPGCFEGAGLDHLADDKVTRNVEATYCSKDGRMLRMLLSGAAIIDDNGNFEGIVLVAQDISIQAEAMRAGHLASLGELAAGVAHEINNPMNIIINFAQILIDELERGEPITEDILRQIIKEGDRVSVIVKSLLSFAREGEKVKEPISVTEIFKETFSLTEIQIRQEGIGLQVDIPEKMPAFVGHFQQIQQVFLNIINNSRYALNKKFPGTDAGKILRIRGGEELRDGRRYLNISFHDTGVGIPASIIDKVKNPFFSTKPSGSGTGLGMAISHGIIADHEGELVIDSKEGEYTTITLFFPVAEEAEDA